MLSIFVSKPISYSEPESVLVRKPSPDDPTKTVEEVTINKGLIGLSVVKIEKNHKEVIKNITFSKISDASYQKTYDRIEFLNLSTKAEQIEQTGETEIELSINADSTTDSDSTGNINISKLGISLLASKGEQQIPDGEEGEQLFEEQFNIDLGDDIDVNAIDGIKNVPNPNTHSSNNITKGILPTEFSSQSTGNSSGSTNGTIQGFMSNAKSRTPAKNIFIYNAFNLNHSKQAIETNIICEVYFVREGFLFELLKNAVDYTINGKVYSLKELTDDNPGKNYTRLREDFQIEFTKFLTLRNNSFQYITTLSTSDTSIYNYEIPVDQRYDYILFLPSASPKSVSQKKPKLEIFYKKLLEDTQASEIPATEEGAFAYPSGEDTPQNVGDYAALYNHLNKIAVEFFVEKYDEFISKFYNYDSIQDDDTDKKFYTLKNIKANINFNLEVKDGT